jgi:signal transduction histidine kinase
VSVGDEQVAVIAHGLLNSMTAVIGGIEVAQRDEQLSETGAAALAAARRQADEVNRTLRQLVQGVPPDTIDLNAQ